MITRRIATDVSCSPTVSVIVPLYNKCNTIGRTLQSVLSQTYNDFEIIIVDDGSTDGGAEFVVNEISDPRVFLYMQDNTGPGSARNSGLGVSRGEFVTFLDADDTWAPQFLERATRLMRQHPECGAFTSSFYLEPEGRDRWLELQAFGFCEGVWRLSPSITRNELRHCLHAFNNTSAFYRRDLANNTSGFYSRDRCTLGEDVYFWIQILLSGPIYRCMEPLAYYHTSDSELGIGAREGELPLEPILTDPDPIRAICPPDLSDTLELWLAHEAARAAFMQLGRGRADNAEWLLHRFPQMRAWPAEYLKLRLRLAYPSLWSLARRIRRR